MEVLLPRALGALLPNLQRLFLIESGASTALVDASFAPPRLSHVEMRDSGVDSVDAWCTLALLPSLASLKLEQTSFPTAALDSVSSKLTALDLDYTCQERRDGVLQPWEEFVRPIAACTRLQSLAFPCAGVKELKMVTAALPQLQRLHLRWADYVSEDDGDAMVEALLGLPRLTSLRWDACEDAALKRSFVDSPCRWRELSFMRITPLQLARLPLHSLTSPVSWDVFTVSGDATVAEVEAAAANVQRNSRHGCAWAEEPDPEEHGLVFSPPEGSRAFVPAPGTTTAALLRAASPLLAGAAGTLRTLQVCNVPWDVEEVRALGEALPRACTRLVLRGDSMTPLACVELAHSLPWLTEVELMWVAVDPAAVAAYVGLLKGQAQGRGEDIPLRSLHALCPTNEQRETWAAVRVLVQAMGVATLHF